MTPLPDATPPVSPLLVAALLLAARGFLTKLGLPCPTAAAILEATGAQRSRAYELCDALLAVLPPLLRSRGRPATAPPPAPSTGDAATVACAVVRFLMDHAGAVSGTGWRRRYTDIFRRFVLTLRDKHRGLDVVAFAAAVGIPVPTLTDWLRPRAATSEDTQTTSPPSEDREDVDAKGPHFETLLADWKGWKKCRGDFAAFCAHARYHLRLPYGRTMIASILEAYGVRVPERRPGRSPDEEALRGEFETFFPGAQSVADGSPVAIELAGVRYLFNVEFVVDPSSGAFTGLSVRDAEDATALVEAFDDAANTTTSTPIALLVDNRSSNLTDEVVAALGDTDLIRATQARPQNKAHVEGGFGLFQQTAPPLVVPGGTPRAVARHVFALVFQTWLRARNHRPRADRGGRSRVELYREGSNPPPEKIAAARKALAERARKQIAARETRRARKEPLVCAIIDEAVARLGLGDPRGNFRSCLARYGVDIVVNAIAVFEGKRDAGTLPPGVDIRYLLGIARNLSDEREGVCISEATLRGREAARDRVHVALADVRDAVERAAVEPNDRLRALVDHALATDRRIDRFFWLQAAATLITSRSHAERGELLRLAAQRIHTTFAVPHRDRLAAWRYLAVKVMPIE